MINFDEVLTFSEAAEKWGLADGKTIRKAVERHRFEPHEIKKSGNVWLTTYDAMYRVFGEPRITKAILYYKDMIAHDHVAETLKAFYEKAYTALERGEAVMVVESKEHPERILNIFKTRKDIEEEEHRLQFFLKMKNT